METKIGKPAKDLTWQSEFPVTLKCDCGGKAELAFAAKEEVGQPEEYVAGLYKNGNDGFWPHDAIAMALYFCRNCFKPIIRWNQS